ncbi:phage holin family protein [Brucella grignonensis]|uniref:Phage holin family protein n=1 Tax=Brucella grignonensis TaxID=94627 RepID=A0A256FFB2_9HYPH|nr:phage holin family protein [Brucella grignonensis]NKB83422.1 phage holin family protein [Brucella grignonensis]OYR13111.1 hypothetical protein CEV33_0834 [Brucella grignonensis]
MLKHLAPVVTSLVGEELELLTGRAKRAAILGAVIAVFGLIAVVFLCVAAFLALAENYGGPIAALILAGLSLILAMLILAVLKIQAASEEKKRKQRIEADKSALMATAAMATVPSILKRPILAVALPLAGIALISLLSDKKKRHSQKNNSRD